MFNKSGINKSSYTNRNQILADIDLQYGVGCIVNEDDGVQVGNKKIAKAGTPILIDTLNIQNPTQPFADESKKPNAVLIHDVDVTNGNANGSALLVGVVNLNRVESDVQTLLTANKDDFNRIGLVQLVKL